MSNDIAMSHKDIATFALFVAAAGFISGYALGTSDHSCKDAVMEQFQSWHKEEQQDFIIAAIKGKDTIKHDIAEDWCAINWKTERVCRNARMYVPVKP